MRAIPEWPVYCPDWHPHRLRVFRLRGILYQVCLRCGAGRRVRAGKRGLLPWLLEPQELLKLTTT